MTPVLAHFGHWWTSIIFAVPFVALISLLTLGRAYERWRDRRREGR
ncbi:MAG TPA: hypothetical protein VHE14_07340 [Solirubrobacteraceae bacterium]|nr:hypothetical protein [Solirubrobacteraceae bacterium]